LSKDGNIPEMKKSMHVAIIGAGFGGLAAANTLSKAGYNVTIFESGSNPGGLALGFKERGWDWTLEHHYHHWFTSDTSILDLAKEINHKVLFIHPKTSTYVEDKIHQVDSPTTLLKFKALTPISRIRTAVMLAYLKLSPWWKNLEGITAYEFIQKTAGKNSWDVLWGPLFIGKFGDYAKNIPASWFWTRINKRSMSLGYPKGGFFEFAKHIEQVLLKTKRVTILYGSPVSKISKQRNSILISSSGIDYKFDKVICTLPTHHFVNITKGLSANYKKKLSTLRGLGAVNLVLRLKKSFLYDKTYWLNVNDLKMPFLAIVEHTNFMDKKHYDNEHLLYIGNYLPSTHEYFNKLSTQLVDEFFPYLVKINSDFKKSWIKRSYVFKAQFAQPLIPLNYSKQIPPFETPIDGLYLCNMQQVYPYDRGTNYAVELGTKVANIVLTNEKGKN
jgi:protoporphyrinogen oxidase